MKKLLLAVVFAFTLALTTSARTGCISTTTHEQSGSCITTTTTVCCEGGCTVIVSTQCY